MDRKQSPAWPYFVVLGCLFALAVASPRAWERNARSGPVEALSSPEVRQCGMIRLGSGPVPGSQEPASPVVMPLVEASLPDTHPGSAEPQPRLVEPAGPIADLRAVDSPVAPVESAPEPPSPATDVAAADREAGLSHLASRPKDGASLPDLTLPGAMRETPSAATLQAAPSAPEPETEPVAEILWEVPESLLGRLEALSQECECGQWAMEVSRLLRRLGAVGVSDAGAKPLLEALHGQVREADLLAAKIAPQPLMAELLRARYALSRRVDLWRQIEPCARPAADVATTAQPDPDRLSRCLAGVEAATRDSTNGQGWREYLMLDSLRRLAGSGERRTVDDQRDLARRVLARLERARVSSPSRRFLDAGPMASLDSELRHWAAEPADARVLLEHVEQYEASGLASHARLIAQDSRVLGWSSAAQEQQLGQEIESRYRNANVRISLSDALLNRLVPQPPITADAVQDRILGLPVRGHSTTETDLVIRLLPDEEHLRVILEAKGIVSSQTSSTSGPATIYNQSNSSYEARKLVQIGLDGVTLSPAEAEASADARLRAVRTDFDPIPLVGWLAKGVARSQYEQNRDDARREVERKVETRARSRIDAEADARIAEAQENFRKRFVVPLEKLSLEPTLISTRTTDRRLETRVRLAGAQQLGAHTPRPQAPSVCVASVQVHQSALNNVLEQLALDGQTFTLPELYRRLGEKLNRPEITAPDSVPEDVRVTFAAQDAVRVRCDEGRVEVTLSIAELVASSQRWYDFTVRVYYRLESSGLNLELARDETIQLIGKRISMRSQIALRGIFSKTFPKDRRLRLTPEPWTTDARLAGLEVIQLVIEDGWIGVAIGPAAEKPRPTVAQAK
ncbi:MAG: hypothetical protein ACYC35_22595 [Pirellulales bacterium]